MPVSDRVRVAVGVIGGVAVASAAVAGIALVSAAALSVYFARRIVTPPGRADSTLRILAIGESTIVLSSAIESRAPGRFSLWFADETGLARIGPVVSQGAQWVARELIEIEKGVPRPGDNARSSGWFYLTPAGLGLEYSQVMVPTELGPAPAWLIPAAHPSTIWAIHIHGRGVQRPETVRALSEFYDAGVTSLAVSYRNDTEAPDSTDGRYGLGSTEYRDVDSAITYALAAGAQRIILMGWSMGGATALHTLVRSANHEKIIGLVLDSPVIAWGPTMELHGDLNRIPSPVQRAAQIVLNSEQARFLVGMEKPLDIAELNFVDRASELDRPILLMHSEDDGYVPVEPSRALAAARPDLVTYEEFDTAGHTRLWNYDSERWLLAIRTWLAALLAENLASAE
ncbi:alpha/beta fold hydrolase [Salinibacterium sp. UTAS2018]|uniref:alpha/beta hydrolase family protein n=1 Tax=Salinibacterium sp. UTAS2018 TaxID=2508880 RepID=UPI0010097A8D|nr:alpha/beta fold hydrolase [Salinibacterium sp. UTAS2018]QAV69529.1 alpha/beta fold hydrolase [Salinibacterium sp. UTAS2018]